jgi:hypothetical protein
MKSYQTIELFPTIRNHIIKFVDSTISDSSYLSAAKLRQLLMEQNIVVSIKLCVNILKLLEVFLHLQTTGKSFKYYIIKKRDCERLKTLDVPEFNGKNLNKYVEALRNSQFDSHIDCSYII